MDVTSKVRWGILGAGGIAHRFARALSHETGSELVAISARSPEKAAAFAETFGVASARTYADEPGAPGSGHERLLADPDVDVIYLALPHGFHRVWAERALRAGKAVLCEKPAALTAAETRSIAAVARETGTFFMEAMKTRFEPAYRAVRQLVDEGAIGAVRRVEASLCNDVDRARWEQSSYYLDPVQGGALLDTGIYCAGWLEDYLLADAAASEGDIATEAVGAATTDSARASFTVTTAEVARYRGVDVFDDAELVAGARTGRLACAFDRTRPRQAIIVGDEGRIVVDDLHRPQRFAIEAPQGSDPRVFEYPYEVDDFYPQIAHVVELVRAGATESPVMPLDASIRCAMLLDAIRAATPGA